MSLPAKRPGKQRREVTSCIPCHSRKQKCDRQYPCSRCARRRQPELCTYYPSANATTGSVSVSLPFADGGRDEDIVQQVASARVPPSSSTKPVLNDGLEQPQSFPPGVSSGSRETPLIRPDASEGSSLAEVFGYFGLSDLDTMALVRKLAPENGTTSLKSTKPLTVEVAAEVRQALEKMPGREILDFLVRYFMVNVNWIDQLLHPPWFMAQYQRWWSLESIHSVADAEFAILLLRVCYYSSQFFPCPAWPLDSIEGVSLADIRQSCENIIDTLTPICRRLNPQGPLVRVQCIALGGLACLGAGRMHSFWEHLSCATRVAQQIGLHLDASTWDNGPDETEKEIGRRMLCNLYIWDSCVSKRLDRIPFLPDDCLRSDNMPRMRLLPPDMNIGVDAPDVFTERLLRAQLAQFWRQHSPARASESKSYDAVAAEQRYEAFCRTFLSTLPPVFALARPDRRWDKKLPALPMQRVLLHMAIFEFLCWNFRPALLQRAGHPVLRGYKQILTAHGKRALAVAALRLLENVVILHASMTGGTPTRFAGIVLPTFEGAVPLLCLCADATFPGDAGGGEERRQQHTGPGEPLDAAVQRMATDPLGARLSSVSRDECLRAVRGALDRLQMSAEVSEMADVGARTLRRLMERVENGDVGAGIVTAQQPDGPNGNVLFDSHEIAAFDGATGWQSMADDIEHT